MAEKWSPGATSRYADKEDSARALSFGAARMRSKDSRLTDCFGMLGVEMKCIYRYYCANKAAVKDAVWFSKDNDFISGDCSPMVKRGQ